MANALRCFENITQPHPFTLLPSNRGHTFDLPPRHEPPLVSYAIRANLEFVSPVPTDSNNLKDRSAACDNDQPNLNHTPKQYPAPPRNLLDSERHNSARGQPQWQHRNPLPGPKPPLPPKQDLSAFIFKQLRHVII